MTWSHLSAFDLDHTLVTDNCSFHFCRYLVSKKILPYSYFFYSFFYYFKHLFFGLSLTNLHKKVFDRLLQGRSFDQFEENVAPFLEQYLLLKLNPAVVQRLRLAQHLGHYTLILSNSPSFLVEKIANFLGVNEWRATEYAIDKDRNLCHIASIMQGEEKVSSVNEVARKLTIAKENITAYSDSFHDLPLLLSAGIPIAVNPDSKLRRFSQLQQWKILTAE